MVTGASNAQLAIILIDARHGVTEQTKRHTYIAHLLGIEHLVVAVNKMDLRDFSQEVFLQIQQDYNNFAAPLGLGEVVFIPMAALNGDNIVHRSVRMAWYAGKTLLEHLEQVPVHQDIVQKDARFQVQYVLRPQTDALHDYRGYAGKVLSGVYKVGDEITILPAGLTTKIKAIEFAEKDIAEAFAPMSVVLHIEDNIDISRGDMFVKTGELPALAQEMQATLCWMDNKALKAGAKYLLQTNSRRVRCVVRELMDKTNIQTLEKLEATEGFLLNDIGTVTIKTAEALPIDVYTHNKTNGSFILIDEQTNNTVGAGMVAEIC
jgi:sulfate adenylyltransferase subunit 1